MKIKSLSICLVAASMLSACSATTNLRAKQTDVTLKVNKTPAVSLNQTPDQKFPTTSFGQLIFEASKQGSEPMYGLVPLKFNGGYLAADILFFAPAMLFNLREVYPYYEFDMEKGVVRYKKKLTDPWLEYKPNAAEIERAKAYFK